MNYGKKVKAWSAGLIFSVATSFASAGPIATMDLKFGSDGIKFPEGYRTGTITKETSDGTNQSRVAAGMFRFSVNNIQGDTPFPLSSNDVLDAFCVDIDTPLDQYNTVSYSLLSATDYFQNSRKVNLMSSLYTGFGGDEVKDSRTSAAFQLALWEIINENTEQLSLSDGSFTSTDFTDAKEAANGWFTGLGDIVSGFNLFVLESDSDADGNKLSQDLLVFSPAPPVKVPEPGTLALLALGICGLVLRKASKRSKD